ncbi:MAG: ribonuclease H-like domain-containing protein [Deltaproteobacteria bacterium]|nr:ribonuclease H-like domain-containing protein [Deltaproteobacteria bacterium]
MSSLLGKLARLERLRELRGEGPPSAAPAAASPEGEPASSPPPMGDASVERETRSTESLDDARIAFEAIEGARGVRYVRRSIDASAKQVGKLSLGHALKADLRLLARLALDPALESVNLEGALYLDTETSGLGGGTGNRAFLVGLAWFDAERDAFVMEQLFLRDLDDEAALLAHVLERVEASSFLVSYNGKSFDWPLLRTRAMLSRLGPVPERPHLDLLHLARRVHDRRSFRMSLGTVERRVLDYDRGPDIGGEEVAMRYARYLFCGDEGPLEEVVTHNQHDVRSLVALLGHYGRATTAPTGVEAGFGVPEWSAIARVMRRAGDLDWAKLIADRAVDVRDDDDADAADALFTRARIAKALGDRSLAVADLEALLARVDDPDARLELAKLYEHFLREPQRALELVERGTSETASSTTVRRTRLQKKVERRGRRRGE